MQDDERAIRELIAEWQSAASTGNVERLQRLMSDDVVFLTPGQQPLCGKQAFLRAFEEGMKNFIIESQGEIRDLHVHADFAYCWSYLSVTMTPFHEGLPIHRSGNTLTILHKLPSGWVIVRDANLLTPKPVPVPA